VVPPAGSAFDGPGHPGAGPRTPSWRAIGRHPHGSRATFAPPFLRRFQHPALSGRPVWRYSSRSSPCEAGSVAGDPAIRDARHAIRVDDRKLGSVVRALRRRRRWRQVDLAGRAKLSQATLSRAERGSLDSLSLRSLRALCSALEIKLELVPRWRGAELDRLMDEHHATLAAGVVAVLERLGWADAVEVTYSRFGERGSIDILGGHAPTKAICVIEIKTELVSIEETARRLDQKVRLAADIARDRFGWLPGSTSRILVLPDRWPERRRANRHALLVSRLFPVQGRQVRAWLRRPVGHIDGLWFHTFTHRRTGKRIQPAPNRVRRPRTGSS
jgi:transcriptional regulator with XRE-family HTH domain